MRTPVDNFPPAVAALAPDAAPQRLRRICRRVGAAAEKDTRVIPGVLLSWAGRRESRFGTEGESDVI